MIYFTSDHHFGHKNIIKYCNRPFDTIDDMDNYFIYIWNNTVKEGDTIYYLGDFTFKNKPDLYLSKLNGLILFIPGGYDRWIKKYGYKTQKILAPLVSFKISDVPTGTIVLCHYAMKVWDKS